MKAWLLGLGFRIGTKKIRTFCAEHMLMELFEYRHTNSMCWFAYDTEQEMVFGLPYAYKLMCEYR